MRESIELWRVDEVDMTKKKNRIRAGVVGTGIMGTHHSRIYSSMENVELIGVCDIDIDRGKAVAQKYNTKFYKDYEDLLNEEPDVVSVAVPTSLHREVAEAAIDKGAHLLVEKPLADTIENAWAIMNRCKERNRLLMVGHIERFNPVVQSLKNLLALGSMGKVELISTLRVAPYPKRITDAGIILDVSCHDIDLISFVTGLKALKVRAYAKQEFHHYEDEAIINLTYTNGMAGIVETSWHYPYKNRRLFVRLESGTVLINFMKQALVVYNGKQAAEVHVDSAEPLALEMQAFVDAASNGKPSPVNGEDSIYTLQVTSSAVKSYKESRQIKLYDSTSNNTYRTPVLVTI